MLSVGLAKITPGLTTDLFPKMSIQIDILIAFKNIICQQIKVVS